MLLIMKKSKILKVCKNYTKFFKSQTEVSNIKHIEYCDFVILHVNPKSYLAFETHKLNDIKKYIEHSISITKFISDNDSKINYTKSNFLSRFNNSEILTALIFLLPIIFYSGYYFGENQQNSKINELSNNIERINKLFIQKTSNLTDTISNKKTDIYDNNQNDKK
ncbi:MAG: hypothetical protein COA67_02075 [Lutibacter sp.]|nr:MAG: hypothetical protein COA67_02075 [Lutibacter sp.]